MQPDTILNNRYRIIYAIDERPNGQLLRGRDEQSGNLVLVALLPCTAEHLAGTAALARQIATVQHPQLQPLLDHFADGERYVLVCADTGGQGMEQALRANGGPLNEQTTIANVSSLLQLIEHLQQQKPPLSFGDFWPSDIQVNANGWRLTPFVLARLVSATPTSYRAPELADPDVEPSSTTDTYALAALLYQALTGYAPPTPEQQKAGTPLQAPRTLNPSLSSLVEQALLRGLQLKSGNRYQHAREFRLALETIHLMAGRSLGLGPDTVPPSAVPVDTVQPVSQELAAAAVTPITAPLPPIDIPYNTTTSTAPPSPQAPTRNGLSTGCLIALALGFALLAVGAAIVLVIALAASGAFTSRGAPLFSNNSTASIPLGPSAITLSNVNAITETAEITGELFGPIKYSPDGKQLAIGINNGVSLTDTDLKEQRRLNGHHGDVIVVDYSPDGKTLATAAMNDNDIRLWNPATGELLYTLSGHTDWLRSVAFSPDGKLLASGSVDQTIRLWDVANGKLLSTLTGHTNWIGNLAFSPDGASLASTSRDGTVRLWNIATGRERSTFTYKARTSSNDSGTIWTTGLAFSPDGKRLAVGSIDGTIAILDAQNGTVERRLTGHEGLVVLRGVVYSPNGKNIYSTATDGTVRVWDVDSGTQVGEFNGHTLEVIGLSLSPDGKYLASASSEEGQIVIWDTASRQIVHQLHSGQGLITNLAYAPDGHTLSLTGITGALRLLSTKGDKDQTSPSGTAMFTVFLGNTLGTISDQGEVRLLLNNQNKALSGLSGKAISLAAARNGALLAAGNDSSVIALWDKNGRALGTIQSELPSIRSIALSDDGHYLAVSGPFGVTDIEIWDTTTLSRVQTLVGLRNGVVAVAFQPNSTHIAGIDIAGELLLWNAVDGKLIHLITAEQQQDSFNALTFSPDGKMIVTGSVSGTLSAWSVADGAKAATVPVSRQSILALAFSPDGQQLAVSVRNENASVYTFELRK